MAIKATPLLIGVGLAGLALLALRKPAKADEQYALNDCPKGPLTEDEIRCVQGQLHGMSLYGALSPAAAITGKVDAATSAALVQFQRNNGLPTTGQLDRATRNWFGPLCVEDCASTGGGDVTTSSNAEKGTRI